jgi:dolichol-phosphate mannosyltransferase
VFKENMGRARPRDIVEFGGTKTFTPPLVPSRECARNCSFISGEASSIYAAFFALALLIPQYRMGLLISGIAAGTLAGIVRIIQGAHFLSDVLFAGVFMAITVSLLHIAFIGLWRDPRRIWNAVTAALLPYEGERSNEEARMTESPERNPVHQGEFALPADAIAVVIPALNEAGNIGNLVRETIGCVPAYALREIIVVDDGSNDETPAEVQALLATVPKLRYLRHAIRAGQSAAVRSGVRAASAPLIATMDGDGQNDPHDIPALVALLQKSAHANIALVGGVRTARRAESSKRIASKFANWLRDAILRDNCPDTGCGIKVFRRDAFVDLPYFSGMHRYLPALFQAYGHGAVYHPVNDRPRRAGSSKYTNFGRALLGIYDLIGVRWLIKRTALPNASAPIRRALSDDLPAHTPNEERLWLQN